MQVRTGAVYPYSCLRPILDLDYRMEDVEYVVDLLENQRITKYETQSEDGTTTELMIAPHIMAALISKCQYTKTGSNNYKPRNAEEVEDAIQYVVTHKLNTEYYGSAKNKRRSCQKNQPNRQILTEIHLKCFSSANNLQSG